MATKTADQVFGEFPIARRPARLHPPEARTIATIPARTASGRRCQTAATSATSAGITSASIELPNRSAWSAVGLGTRPPKRALLRSPLAPTLWPSGEPAVNDCPDTAAVVLGERAPGLDQSSQIGGDYVGFCSCDSPDCGISR